MTPMAETGRAMGTGNSMSLGHTGEVSDVTGTDVRSGNRLVPAAGETILVVDDEDALREFVTQVLESRGSCVLSAESAAHALQKCSQSERPIDLLLTDIIMPGGMSGAELAERLQTQQPGLKVIYASGFSPGMGPKELAVLNRPNFLPKPYGMHKLLETVSASLAQAG